METFLLRDLPRYECLQEKARRYPDLDIGAVETTLILLRVASDVMEGMSSNFSRHGMSQGRFVVLSLLDRNGATGSLLPSEIADKLNVTRATVTGLLDSLEKDGYIQRRAHPEDRRAISVYLTDDGRKFLEQISPQHYRRIAGLMAHLSEEERSVLIQLLTKVAQGTDAFRQDDEEEPKSTLHRSGEKK